MTMTMILPLESTAVHGIVIRCAADTCFIVASLCVTDFTTLQSVRQNLKGACFALSRHGELLTSYFGFLEEDLCSAFDKRL